MNDITDVPGIRVGHYTNTAAATGCTVVLCEDGAVGGVDVRGSSPGTRETDLLRPMNNVSEAQAALLSGGSAFGLDAASGVVRYLEERGIGYRVGEGIVVPIVPAAILFDLRLVTHRTRPGPDDGYAACLRATSGRVAEGSVGAGTGATVAKALGPSRSLKGGIGTASIDLGEGVIVGAIAAANAIGGIYDADSGALVAGPRGDDGAMLESLSLITTPGYTREPPPAATNTTIGIVATSARLSKEQANKLASAAHDGLALAVRPAHTMNDGDTLFALATGTVDGEPDMYRLCAAAALCTARAIANGVRAATGLGGVPAVGELG